MMLPSALASVRYSERLIRSRSSSDDTCSVRPSYTFFAVAVIAHRSFAVP
jgi:hypothetical protein